MLTSEPVDAKFEAFGWHVQRIDGNDMEAVVTALDAARNLTEPVPRVIICDTKMAKGIPFLEERERNHFLRVEAHEWAEVIKHLDEGRTQRNTKNSENATRARLYPKAKP